MIQGFYLGFACFQLHFFSDWQSSLVLILSMYRLTALSLTPIIQVNFLGIVQSPPSIDQVLLLSKNPWAFFDQKNDYCKNLMFFWFHRTF